MSGLSHLERSALLPLSGCVHETKLANKATLSFPAAREVLISWSVVGKGCQVRSLLCVPRHLFGDGVHAPGDMCVERHASAVDGRERKPSGRGGVEAKSSSSSEDRAV